MDLADQYESTAKDRKWAWLVMKAISIVAIKQRLRNSEVLSHGYTNIKVPELEIRLILI